MTHPRKTIREKIKATLLAANISTITTNVFKSRRSPIQANESGALPCLLIYSGDELPLEGETCDGKMDRTWLVAVEIVAKDPDSATLEDDVDDIAEAVEEALKDLSLFTAQDSGLVDTFQDLRYSGQKIRMALGPDGLEYAMGMILTFNVRYWH